MIRTKTIAKWCRRWTVAISMIGVAFIAYVIATSPEPYVDDSPAAQVVCLDDDVNDFYVNPDFTPWSDLFQDGQEYGKDGEVIAHGAAERPERSAPPMARMPWLAPRGSQGGSIDKQGCAPSVVSEPKSWHLIIIGILSFAVWRWVGKET